MSVTIYGLKNCDTCRKALKEITASGQGVNLVDVRADGLDETKLTTWLETFGKDVVLNTRSTTWRGLGDEERAISSPEDVVALILKHPTLLKRPVIEYEGGTIVGWAKKQQDTFRENVGNL